MTREQKRLKIGIALAAVIIAAVALLALLLIDDGDRKPSARSEPTESSVPVNRWHAPSSTMTPSAARLARIVIPSIGVDAPVSIKGIAEDGAMQPPDGPDEVAWYSFTARPGAGGNAVFSAHVDYHDYGPAVFARLRDLEKGDSVEVRLTDGTSYVYKVSLSLVYEADSAPSQEIVGPTTREVVTLITCAGVFDEATGGYNERLVVRADRA